MLLDFLLNLDETQIALLLMIYFLTVILVWVCGLFPVWLEIILSFWPLLFVVLIYLVSRVFIKLFPNKFGTTKEERLWDEKPCERFRECGDLEDEFDNLYDLFWNDNIGCDNQK